MFLFSKTRSRLRPHIFLVKFADQQSRSRCLSSQSPLCPQPNPHPDRSSSLARPEHRRCSNALRRLWRLNASLGGGATPHSSALRPVASLGANAYGVRSSLRRSLRSLILSALRASPYRGGGTTTPTFEEGVNTCAKHSTQPAGLYHQPPG